MKCSECGGPMVETEPEEGDVWLGEPEGDATVYLCEKCQTLEAA